MKNKKEKIIDAHGLTVRYDRLDSEGREILDPNPIAVPIGYGAPETLEAKMARMIKGYVSQIAHREGLETLEESLDFKVGDDFDPKTPYELAADNAEALEADQANIREMMIEELKKMKEAPPPPSSPPAPETPPVHPLSGGSLP